MEVSTDDGSYGPLLGDFMADHFLVGHHFTHRFCSYTFELKDKCIVCGKVAGTGDNVLFDIEHVLYQGILCFQNAIQFLSIRVDVILFMPIRKVWLFLWQFS